MTQGSTPKIFQNHLLILLIVKLLILPERLFKPPFYNKMNFKHFTDQNLDLHENIIQKGFYKKILQKSFERN
jgi:hypothetical protein